MTTQTEALKLALEALNAAEDLMHRMGMQSSDAYQETDAAITAIKETLQSNEQVEPDSLFEAFKEFGEGWESLAWELCADENGEEACTELIWEGGPIPEPWGDRWLKYEDEAKRLIALVHKHTHPPVPTAQPEQEPVDLKAIRLVLLLTDHPADKAPKEIQEAFANGWNGALDALEKLGKLYTTPPKRTWVGLTDEDVMSITFNFDVSSLSLVAKAVEAKLREKNT